MAFKSISTLKTYFEAGDFPTSSQFDDLIDSALGGVVFDIRAFGAVAGQDAKTALEDTIDAALAAVGDWLVVAEQDTEGRPTAFRLAFAPAPAGWRLTLNVAAVPALGEHGVEHTESNAKGVLEEGMLTDREQLAAPSHMTRGAPAPLPLDEDFGAPELPVG